MSCSVFVWYNDLTMWSIIFFSSSGGRIYVNDFIQTLLPQTKAKLIRIIDLLEQFGPELPMPYSKKITPNLYELRVLGKNNLRILYTIDSDEREIILLHAFAKKSQKLNVKDISLAESRRKRIDRL